MKPWIIFLIIIVILAALIIGLYFYGKRLQKKQAESREQIEAMKQSVTMLIIDKKRLRIKDSGLPQMVIDQTPKRMRFTKLPIVKAKVGPKISTFICDENVYDLIPVKKEVRAMVSGLYITEVRGIRGSLNPKPEKKGFFARLRGKAESYTAAEPASSSKKGKKK